MLLDVRTPKDGMPAQVDQNGKGVFSRTRNTRLRGCQMSSKIFIHSVVAVTCLFSALSLKAQQVLFNDMKITPRWVYDPGIQATTVPSLTTKKPLKWLELDVDYTTATLRKASWLDNVTMRYRILLPKVGRRQVVLSGEVEYWAIPMDGDRHHAQAFVHPRFLQRYAPGVKLKKRDLQSIRITVTFIQNESVVGKGVFKPKRNMSATALGKDLQRALANRSTLKINHSVFSRDETPWGVLNINYYELIKRKK